jgi:CHAD domain-containing protein
VERAVKRMEKLQNSLGETHDCVVVEQHLREKIESSDSIRSVLLRLAKRKAALEKKAKKIAGKVGETLEA